MSDQRDIIRQLEEMLGSEESPEMAELMFVKLKSSGHIEFDAQDGYSFVRSSGLQDCEPDQVFEAAWVAEYVAAVQA